MKKYLYLIIPLLTAILLTTACGKADLQYPTRSREIVRQTIIIDNHTQQLFPNVTVALYPDNIDTTTLLKTLPSNNVTFDIPKGTYNIHLYANGGNIALIDQHTFFDNKAHIITPTTTPTSAKAIPNSKPLPNADSLYSLPLVNTPVLPGATPIQATLTSLTKYFRLNLERGTNKEITHAQAIISGVAQTINLASQKAIYQTDFYTTHLKLAGQTQSQLTFTCTYFGTMPKPENPTPSTPKHPNNIVVEITYSDNTTKEITGDLTKVFDDIGDNNSNVEISIATIGSAAYVVDWTTGDGNSNIIEK